MIAASLLTLWLLNTREQLLPEPVWAVCVCVFGFAYCHVCLTLTVFLKLSCASGSLEDLFKMQILMKRVQGGARDANSWSKEHT